MANRAPLVKTLRRALVVGAAVLGAILLLWVGRALRPPRLNVFPAMPVLYDVTVVNPGRDRRPLQTLTLRDGRIAAITDDDGQPRLPRFRLYRGFYALPGLIDLQLRRLPSAAHLRRLMGIYFLNAGVTTVRLVGTVDLPPAALRAAVSTDTTPWPRLVACGRMLTGAAPGCRLGQPVEAADRAAAAVDALAADGAECLALHHSLAADVVPAVRAAAAARGLPLVGDLPPGVAPADAGLRDVDLLTLAAPLPPARQAADWLHAWRAMDPAALAALTRALVVSAGGAGGVASTVTSTGARWALLPHLDDPELGRMPFVALLPRSERGLRWRREAEATGVITPADLAAASYAMRAALVALHAAGVPIAIGSGAPSVAIPPGAGLWQELVPLAAAIGPEAAWAAATRDAGAALGIPQLGVLEAGAPADLLLFRRDPTADLSALTSLEAVIIGGHLYPVRRLNGDMLEVARYVEHPLYDRLSMFATQASTWWSGGEDDCAPL